MRFEAKFLLYASIQGKQVSVPVRDSERVQLAGVRNDGCLMYIQTLNKHCIVINIIFILVFLQTLGLVNYCSYVCAVHFGFSKFAQYGPQLYNEWMIITTR